MKFTQLSNAQYKMNYFIITKNWQISWVLWFCFYLTHSQNLMICYEIYVDIVVVYFISISMKLLDKMTKRTAKVMSWRIGPKWSLFKCKYIFKKKLNNYMYWSYIKYFVFVKKEEEEKNSWGEQIVLIVFNFVPLVWYIRYFLCI